MGFFFTLTDIVHVALSTSYHPPWSGEEEEEEEEAEAEQEEGQGVSPLLRTGRVEGQRFRDFRICSLDSSFGVAIGFYFLCSFLASSSNSSSSSNNNNSSNIFIYWPSWNDLCWIHCNYVAGNHSRFHVYGHLKWCALLP